ncbi:D-alanyl-D-alanine carboxypeptidase/D-alanyl-D-alanine-endopeptidase [Demequina sp. NBRC 110055]|uniref:D-alanyl-D-alanine carboxypeptidase/D-alanyl-D-alanine endopeptidase n=1 Tax=Demequina sp. NBRC 110055 TaxID=1570344 RepID=UPI000A0353AD|nr:D-alanyl-D-alanine carboxypeptidase/D-alanyl-D-alanine-endopeptidase [Demequina sp. NBRC 110055]
MRARVAVGAVAVLALGGAYLWLDAADAVPGFLTASPEAVAPAPFRTAEAVEPSPAARVDVMGVTDGPALPAAARVQELAEAVRADSRTGESTNVSVIDLVTGEVLADVDAADTQVPASTTKLLTSVSAVVDLGDDYRMTTSATWDASSRTVTLVAGGDMLLAGDAGHGGEGEDANGWAGLGDLADAVASAVPDLGSAPVTLAVDDSAFEGPALNPEWPAYAMTSGYVAAATGLAVDAARMTDEHYAPRYDDPSLAAGDVFAARLGERGVTVEGEVTRASAVGDVVATVEGAPLADVAALTLYESDNTIAEITARVHALETGRATTPKGAAKATRAGLTALGVNVAGLELYDGAGFSENNRISPAMLTQTLQLAYADPATSELPDWLPVGALEGTVSGRYEDTAAAGQMRAKTGSLTGVSSLAGVVQTADGRWLAFATMADGMEYNPQGPRDTFDDMVVALAECSCEG